MAQYDGRIKIDTAIDSQGFNRGVSGMTTSLTKLRGVITSVGAAIGVAFGLSALVAFGANAVKAASDAQSAMLGLQSVVEGTGNSFSEAQNFINAFVSDGLMPAQNAITAYKNLLLRGYDTTQIQQTLTALKDSAAFGRSAHLTLGEAVQTAAEGLKNENSILVDNAGVTRNVSLMWRDYAESIGTTVGALTQQQKIQAEVNGILNESRFQVGDAAKLANTYAGQVGALSASFLNLRIAVGNSVIPIITAIIPYIRKAIDALTILFNRAALIVSILFGVQIGAQANQTAAAMDNVAGSAGKAANAQDKLAKNTDKASKAAKGALASFDELNVLQQQQDDSTGGGAGSSDVDIPAIDAGSLSVPPIDTKAADESLEELRGKVEKWKKSFLEYISPVTEAFGRLVDALKPLGVTIWDGLKWAWDNILVPLGNWVINDFLPKFLDTLAQAAETLNPILENLEPVGIFFLDNFLKPLGEFVGDAILKFLDWLTERLKELQKWVEENPQKFQELVASIILGVAMFAALYKIIILVIAVFFALQSPIGLIALALGLIIGVVLYVIDHFDELKTTAYQLGFIIAYYFRQMADTVKSKAREMAESVVKWFENLKQGIVDKISQMRERVTSTFAAIRNSVTNTVNEMVAKMNDSFRSGLDKVVGFFRDKLGTLKGIMASVANSVIDVINSMISRITSGINTIIGGINSVSGLVGIPSIGLVTAAQIPHLATGAVIPPNAQFLAMLGDQRAGKNIEAPENLLRQIVREESGGQGVGEVVIRFEGSLSALVRELKPYIDAETTRRGASLVVGTT